MTDLIQTNVIVDRIAETLLSPEVRLFRTADFDCSRSGVCGQSSECVYAYFSPWRAASIRRGEKHDHVLNLLNSSAFVGTNLEALFPDCS